MDSNIELKLLWKLKKKKSWGGVLFCGGLGGGIEKIEVIVKLQEKKVGG